MICPFWKRGGCKWSAERCVYEHRNCDHTGRSFKLAEMPRTDHVTGRTIAGHNVVLAQERSARIAAQRAQHAAPSRSNKLDRIQTQNWRQTTPAAHDALPQLVETSSTVAGAWSKIVNAPLSDADALLKKRISNDSLLSSQDTTSRTTGHTSLDLRPNAGPIISSTHPGVQGAELLLVNESDSIFGLRFSDMPPPPKGQLRKCSQYQVRDAESGELRCLVDLPDMATAPIGSARPSQLIRVLRQYSPAYANVGSTHLVLHRF